MSAVQSLSKDEQTFLAAYLPGNIMKLSTHGEPAFGSPIQAKVIDNDLPFVTVTYACSLDGMIALAPGLRTTLSGPETKSMTHYLRAYHDAILVGVSTAVIDDPGLNCRYPGSTLQDQPRPVIVDPNGRWNPGSKKVCKLASEDSGKAPWVITNIETAYSETLRQIGGDTILGQEMDSDRSEPVERGSSFPWRSILKSLKSRGIDSVMIEGGATVLRALLADPELVDAVIVTIAPTWLGQGGIVASPMPKTMPGKRENAGWLQDTAWRQFGSDAVVCGRLKRS